MAEGCGWGAGWEITGGWEGEEWVCEGCGGFVRWIMKGGGRVGMGGFGGE